MDSISKQPVIPTSSNGLWSQLLDRFRQLCGYRFPPLGPIGFATISKILPSTIGTQLFQGIKAVLDLRDETQRTTYWFGTRFETPTPQILRDWASYATHFFDVGSNYGFYSFFLHSQCPNLQIYPFEPNPTSFRRLSEICASNGTFRIHPQHYGLSDENKRLQFVQLADNTGHSSFATATAFDDNGLLLGPAALTESDVIKFDEAIVRLGLSYPTKPGWVAKIDVEGYEMKVLCGMANALRAHAFNGICIELVPDNLSIAGTSVEEVDALLRNHGYQEMRKLRVTRKDRNHNAFYIPVEMDPAEKRISDKKVPE